MVGYTYKWNVAIWTRKVKNPRKHLKHQVVVHNQGSYPYVYDSFNTEREANKVANKLIKLVKKAEKLNKRIRI